MRAKHPRDSETIMSELMMPHHANLMGNVFGGVILALVDRAAKRRATRVMDRRYDTGAGE